jgi:hypothetical protein
MVAQELWTDVITVFVNPINSRGTGHIFKCICLPCMMLIHQFFPCSGDLELTVFIELIHKSTGVIQDLFLHQAVHAGVGFDECTIHTLTLSPDHSLIDTKFKHLLKELQEGLLTIQLPGSADGAVKWKLFLQIIAEEQSDAEAVCAKTDQCPITVDVVEIPHQEDLEEDYGINALLTLTALISSGCLV